MEKQQTKEHQKTGETRTCEKCLDQLKRIKMPVYTDGNYKYATCPECGQRWGWK